MLAYVLVSAVLPAAVVSLAPKLQRVSLGGPATVAPWYKERFGVEVDGAGEVVFGDGFRLKFEEGGPAQTEYGCLGVGVEVADGAALVAAAGGESLEDVEWYACMIPDEDPDQVANLEVADLEDPGGRRVVASRAVSDGGASSRTPAAPAPKVTLCVKDILASVEFYTTALGMTLLKKRALLPHHAAMSAYVGYSDADAGPEAGAAGVARLELRYRYNNDRVDPDATIAVINDPAMCAIRAPVCGGAVAAETAATATLTDPDGYTVVVAATAADL